jgi:hypothetical protein
VLGRQAFDKTGDVHKASIKALARASPGQLAQATQTSSGHMHSGNKRVVERRIDFLSLVLVLCCGLSVAEEVIEHAGRANRGP